MALADEVQGRTISVAIHMRLIPPPTELGKTDAAMLIGQGLVKEATTLLKNAAEAEGFSVEMNVNLVVY